MERIKLGEVCEIVSGSTPKTSVDEYWDGDIDWITPAELNDETYIIEESQRKITHIAVQKTGLKPFPQGTVILSSRAPIGKVAIAGKEMYCNQGFKNLICSDRIDSRYLYWYLKGHTDYLNSLGRGATFKEISKTIVENIEIPLPNLDTQIRCSNILKKCWDLISTQRVQIEAYNTLIKSRFVEMFGDPVINQLGWKQSSMDSVCERITDGEHGSVPRTESGYMFLNAKHIKTDGSIDFKTVTYVDSKTHEKIYKRCNPEPEDILLTTTGTIGNVAIVPKTEQFSMDRGITLLKLDRTIIKSVFMANLLKFESMQNIMSSNVHASAIGHLFLNKVMKLPVIIPPMEMQERFTSFVEETDKLKSATQKSLNETQQLFDSLMQKYFG